MESLFSDNETSLEKAFVPLADRLRPKKLEEFVGQEHLVGKGKILRKAIEKGEITSIIFWGPPGSGKTTLARIIASSSNANFVEFSAVISGIKEIKEVIQEAERQRKLYGRKTILFVDEIHRFNKAQQDAFLPHVEKGTIILIGATTENPSFEVISALLSRCKVYTLNILTIDELKLIAERAICDEEKGLGKFKPSLSENALSHLLNLSNGDARVLLNTLEISVLTASVSDDGKREISLEIIEDAIQKRALLYDKTGEEHYNLISALHKSLRGSDPDASLYWLARMLVSGEDPLYIARRMVRFATEDIGNADPQALSIALAAKDAYHFLGTPEGELALAQAAIYLACAPKSNSVYKAFSIAQRDVEENPALPVPMHIRNAPTNLMKEMGYGKGYKYAHDYPEHIVKQEYFPLNLRGRKYYFPTDSGFEREIKRRLEYWRKKLGK